MNRKIIFFDVDGTLYIPNHNGITDKVKEAIVKTREKGHLCFIASGRPVGFIADNIKEIGFDGFVLANGANIKYNEQDLAVRYLDYHHIKEVVDCLREKNIEYVFETPTYCYMSQNNKHFKEFYKLCNIDLDNIKHEYDEDEVLHRTIKLEVWADSQEELDYAVSCFKNFAYEIHPDNHSMEVYSKVVSKATGILDVLKLLNIDIKDSYCFGDGPNDVEMFETVGHAIAMGNAIDIIKEKADEICLSVQQDGVAYKLEELFDL